MNAKTPAVDRPASRRIMFLMVPTAQPPDEGVLAGLSVEDRDLLTHLLSTPCEYLNHPSFRRKGTEAALFGRVARLGRRTTYFAETPSIYQDTDRGEGNGVTLTTAQEQTLFQRFNYARRRVYEVLDANAGKRLCERDMRLLLAWAHRVLLVRSEIVQTNVPLVLAMAKRTRLSGVDFGELISEGNMALLRSVDKFDCTRGFKFSTYACRAILKSFSRVAMRTSRYRGRFPTEFDPTLERSDFVEQRRHGVEEDCVSELRDILNHNLAALSEIEERVIRERFAIDDTPSDQPATPKTLEQVGALIGVTKERVRQIQNKALQKIRVALEESILAA